MPYALPDEGQREQGGVGYDEDAAVIDRYSVKRIGAQQARDLIEVELQHDQLNDMGDGGQNSFKYAGI